VRVGTRVVAADSGALRLSDGGRLHAGTVVWTGGVRANPLLGRLGIPSDPHGRLRTLATLQVEGAPHVWAAGDGASVPDLTDDDHDADPRCAGTAQHAVRQARVLASNLAATLRGAELVDYRHRDAGSVATLGLHRGVALIFGVPLHGPAAWLVHRAYHLAMVPTWGRKVRVILGWVAALIGRRDLATPRAALEDEPAWEHPADRLEAGA
jgi:NADH dehydrogenase